MLREFNKKDCSDVKTLTTRAEKLNDLESPACNVTKYRSIVGKLTFASKTVRFDMLYVQLKISERTNKSQLRAANQILRYLKDNSDFGITYKSGTELKVDGYLDVN
jgi:hypothetical protein